MSDPRKDELSALSNKWDNALQSKDYDLALQIAVQGYALARNTKDRVSALMFLGFTRHAATTLYGMQSRNAAAKEPKGENVCSFCLANKARLVKGVDVAICAECIEKAHSIV
jgi:hypothetical protein